MIYVHYFDKGTRDVAANLNSKDARRALPRELHELARRRLAFLVAAESLDDLRSWPGLNLDALREDRRGQYAIRINDKYRICFLWTGQGADRIEITDYH